MFFYNILIYLVLLLLSPIHLVRLCMGTKYRRSTMPRLGWQSLPRRADFEGRVYLLHAVSVGESQVAGVVAAKLKQEDPSCRIYLSTVTETGQDVALSLKAKDLIDDCFFFLHDVSFLQARLFKGLVPSAVIVIETDLWVAYLREAQKRDIPIFLFNGKLSENSMRGYQKWSFLQRHLISPIAKLFVQSETYAERFKACGVASEKINVFGNIKLDSEVKALSTDELANLRQAWGLVADDQVLVFASTHAGEEEMALAVLRKLCSDFPKLKVIVVPRHPERFVGIAKMYENEGEVISRISTSEFNVEAKLILLDQMGVLMQAYQLADIAIVCGSFTEKVGGHNILEPAYFSKPFIYGPWIYKQPGFHQLCLQGEVSTQVSMEDLAEKLREFLLQPEQGQFLGKKAYELVQNSKGATEQSVQEMLKSLN